MIAQEEAIEGFLQVALLIYLALEPLVQELVRRLLALLAIGALAMSEAI